MGGFKRIRYVLVLSNITMQIPVFIKYDGNHSFFIVCINSKSLLRMALSTRFVWLMCLVTTKSCNCGCPEVRDTTHSASRMMIMTSTWLWDWGTPSKFAEDLLSPGLSEDMHLSSKAFTRISILLQAKPFPAFLQMTFGEDGLKRLLPHILLIIPVENNSRIPLDFLCLGSIYAIDSPIIPAMLTQGYLKLRIWGYKVTYIELSRNGFDVSLKD